MTVTKEQVYARAADQGIGLMQARDQLYADAREARVDRLQSFAQERINDLPEGDEQYALQAIFDWIAVALEKPE